VEFLRLVAGVETPARYLGGEINEVRKSWAEVDLRLALAFPDVYEVGMSHLGLAILYDVVNRRPDALAERVFAAWPDLEAELRRTGTPLRSLESRRPLKEFDVLGFSLQHELSYPAVLVMLDLAGIPRRSDARGRADPIVLGGGPGSFHPEPMADFFDAFLLGDGEEAIHEILDAVRDARPHGRVAVLEALARVPGVYVPAFFKPVYESERLVALRRVGPSPETIRKRVVADLDRAPFPEKPLVPNVLVVHDRVSVELQRGCTRACRFCQVGFVGRPNRQRSPKRVLELVTRGLRATGHDEAGFLSLSAGDYACLNPLLEEFFRRYAPERVGVSLPSLRTETLTPALAELVKRVRKSGFTIAPEAGSARLRRVINKGNDAEDLLRAIRATFGAGWNLVKLYFMIGLPTERDDDVLEIAELCRRALFEGRAVRPGVRLTASASTFVPKPHTPFQFAAMIGKAETERRQALLGRALRERGIELKRHDAGQSLVEGILSRGDRRLGRVLERVVDLGARLDNWTEHFRLDRWLTALAEEGISIEEEIGPRDALQCLPWDHLDCGIPKDWLWREWEDAHREIPVEDCALGERPRCSDCGVCDHRLVKNRVFSLESFKGSGEPAAAPPRLAAAKGDRPRGQRLRIRFAKDARGALFGHLDTVRLFERALRRAGLAVVHTLGFNPKPRMVFSPACPVGIESEAEFLDLELCEQTPPQEVARRLGAELPQGFAIRSVVELDRDAPSVAGSLTGYSVVFDLSRSLSEGEIAARIQAFLEAPALLWERWQGKRTRVLDLKVLVGRLEKAGSHRVRAFLRCHPLGSARPAEVLQAVFGLSASAARDTRIVREAAVFEGREASSGPPPAALDKGGNHAPPER
jgi:radical SAM family uncharacterized protein/radical SAM-linked protein